jgi:hypothetical protein
MPEISRFFGIVVSMHYNDPRPTPFPRPLWYAARNYRELIHCVCSPARNFSSQPDLKP